MRNRTRATTLFFIGALISNQAVATAESPIEMLKRTNKKINNLLNKEKSDPAVKKTTHAKLGKIVDKFLDFSELGRLALAKHWEARSSQERNEFITVLHQLIEKSYLKQMRSNLNYSIAYQKESIEGDQASVNTVVKVESKGRKQEIAIGYKMHIVNNQWMVFDVITDDVSMLQNYRSQFNRIIRKDSFAALIKKMKSKLESI